MPISICFGSVTRRQRTYRGSLASISLAMTVACLLGSWPATSPAQTKKSLLFGIDGLGYGTQGFGVANTPNIDSLIQGTWQSGYNGAYGKAFTGGQLGTATAQATVSGPGWTSMLTGVWVDRHGVTGNGATFANGDFLSNPPYLVMLRDHDPGLVTASYVYWPPIDNYIISSGDFDSSATNDVTFHNSYMNDANTAAAGAAGIANLSLDLDAVFISVDLVDAAGHAGGSSSLVYKQAIETADSYLGMALNAIASRPNFANEDWQIVVTADHGHVPTGGHGGQTTLEREIPFVVAGRAVNQGTLPSFPREVAITDAAATILDHFNVPIPSYFFGVSQAGGAFYVDGDINGDGIVSGNGTGPYATDDVTAFVSLWLKPNSVDFPNPADLNRDGIANLDDWAILHQQVPSLAASVLQALRGTPVPEPTGVAIAAIAALIGVVRRSRFPRGAADVGASSGVSKRE